ncbi:Asp-tRNA(Asn)/Glu-tRNA(Gln) amidotransferase GatCAB subunit A [Salicibibacter halophilus]|uniref:Asp-tRNA(Asn)/Glu-tRNA(Gln) amidotransferase GatCAB subunit A n=1 Tax=Salicibibacter halophilus TaxID=2502791 RepID=A0A514LG15_9BACI|nr:amidase [Salicibibacter halophilus]QDI90796.1 Asp-tRNA(Asn)/Glu-tRNA(Gln) amidotransferase GatCAB subunit A [Salicibibacter halophilus]
MTELHTKTASELAPFIKDKQLSPVELTEAIMKQVEKENPSINAYITLLPEVAREQAKHAEKQMMQGLYRGPLHGIPIGIKDNMYTKGIPTTAGSKLLHDFLPHENATSVDKLLAAGCIMIGKLNMHEFGGGLTNTNQFYGNARNPWDLNHTPGGSSGGSSAAISAGLATLATGTDTFGSIREPAAMAGIYGLKPTYGLVSSHGVVPLAPSMDHIGPMARSVPDLALMLQHMAGPDPRDPANIHAPIPNYSDSLTKGIEGIKIAVPGYFLKGLDSDIEFLFKNALEQMENMGAKIIDMDIPELELSSYAAYQTVTGEAGNTFYEKLKTNPEVFNDDVRIFFTSGLATNTNHYVRSQQARRRLVTAFKKTFEDVDIVAAPTVPITAPAFQTAWIEQNLDIIERCMPFTAPANLTGLPSLSVPIGLSSEMLPAGMQFMGDHLTERLLFQVGNSWESINPLGAD